MICLNYKVVVLAGCLAAGSLFAEEGAQQMLDLIDSGRTAEAEAQFDAANLTGASRELVEARIAIERENWQDALRHLARVQVVCYREVDWLPAALFYEALIDYRTGSDEKKCSALDELKTLYPASSWCRRAEKELKKTEKEEGVSE